MAKRIGLLGGSFDPVHHGHLQLARDALSSLKLDEVRFIPCAQPALKDKLQASQADRVAMLDLALFDEPKFVVDDCELKRAGPSYTIDTLQQLKSLCPQDCLFFIMGSDVYSQLTQFKAWQHLIEHADLIVAERAGQTFKLNAELTTFAEQQAEHIHCISTSAPELSATFIRDMIKNAKDANKLIEFLPQAVIDYIKQKKLY